MPQKLLETGVSLEILDFSIRGSIFGTLLVLTVLIWSSRIAREAQIAFTLLTITTTCATWSHLVEAGGVSETVVWVFKGIGTLGAFSITWFALVIFLDAKRFRWLWLGSAAFIAVSTSIVAFWPVLIPALRAFAAVHFIALMGLILYSGRGDLQDARRRSRPVMSMFLLTYSLGQAITSTPIKGIQSTEVAIAQSGVLWVFITIFAVWALKANLSHWPGETSPIAPEKPTPLERSNAQGALVRRVLDAMEEGIWQVEGLTVGGLAQKVAAPEHQVRKAINQGMGYRNFASFINRARIDAAIKRLEAPEAMDETILQIAFDVGFSSLGPFNRAFRETTGQSPTDFRKIAHAQSAVA